MASNVTRDHHNFRRTVSLNGNKISNDGGDEGISVADNGNVTVSGELDIDGAKITSAGALEIDPGGALSITGQDVKIDATKKLYLDGGGDTYIAETAGDALRFITGDVILLQLIENGGGAFDKVTIPTETGLYLDGGGDTYIAETAADTLSFTVGGDRVLTFMEDGGNGNVADYGGNSVGFTQHEPSYDSSDTNVYFNRNGNKAFLTFGSGNITDLNIYFPNVSCNCILLIKQDGTGSRLITNYKTFDQAAGNESTVLFAGGSNPTLTTTGNKLDIVSFYWDNDNHKAYGTVSQNF